MFLSYLTIFLRLLLIPLRTKKNFVLKIPSLLIRLMLDSSWPIEIWIFQILKAFDKLVFVLSHHFSSTPLNPSYNIIFFFFFCLFPSQSFKVFFYIIGTTLLLFFFNYLSNYIITCMNHSNLNSNFLKFLDLKFGIFDVFGCIDLKWSMGFCLCMIYTWFLCLNFKIFMILENFRNWGLCVLE